MHLKRWLTSIFVFGTFGLASSSALAVDPGQIDTFEDGTTQGWIVGAPHPFPPVNIVTGGPAGADDNYALLTAIGGGGPGSRLSAFNFNQWAGDYLAAGITSITMDVNNFGNEELALRLLFADPIFAPPNNIAISADALILPAGSGWTSVSFNVDTASLLTLLGDKNTALSSATELRLFHSATATFPGSAVATSLGVDNIRAVGTAAVPEPSSLIVIGTGLLALSGLQARKRQNLKR